MANKKISKLYIIGVPVVLLMLGLLVTFVYLPIRAEIAAGRQSLSAKQSELESVRAKVKSLVELSEEVERMQEEMRTFEVLIPTEADIPGLLRHLERLKEQSGILINNIDFPQASSTSSVQNIAQGICNLRTSGTYSQVNRFIESIKSSPRLLAVSQAKLMPNNYGQQIDMEITLIYFYRSSTTPKQAQ